jgi:hypothetical protein
MSFRSGYWKGRLALTSAESVETLEAVQGFFRGGRNWTQGVYHASNGQKCLVGAADHVRASPLDAAKYWLEQAIAEKTGIRGIENFNDSRRSFGEIAEVLSRAKELALEHQARQSPRRPAVTHQPQPDRVIEVTEADIERVALLSRRQRKVPSNFHD